ncbi:MAG: thiol-disulfide oxidoreductase DCC family protein [Raineya sp.]|nr:thiol-disulfide oxidoreductase DCC family protein [Raineya sp.]
MPNPVVLFDGVCNLCEGVVKFLIQRDKKDVFRFASLQSEIGQTLLQKFHLPTQNYDSFVLIVGEKAYLRSSAALKICEFLGGFWQVLAVFWLIPKPLRDAVYDFVAKNRYKWLGKKNECMIPSPEIKNKFLS